MKAGILFNLGSFCLGVHYSKYNKRFYINLLPCVTLWITRKGGIAPENMNARLHYTIKH